MIQQQEQKLPFALAGKKPLCKISERGREETCHPCRLISRDRDVATLSPLKISRTIKISFSARDNYCLKKFERDHVRAPPFMLIIPSSSLSLPLLCKSAAFYVYPRADAGWQRLWQWWCLFKRRKPFSPPSGADPAVRWRPLSEI